MVKTPTLVSWPVILPSLAEGETLYSWCSTFHRRAALGHALATSRLLFGGNYCALLHDFPAHLGEFEKRTEGCLGSARELALGHTLLGYFVPFLEAERGESLISAIIVGSVPDLKMRLGIPASGVGGYHPLRYCESCVEDDRRSLGWPIWHLAHQAPSALVCRWHQRPLVQTWHPISPVHRREWLVPDPGKTSTDHRYEISLPNEQSLGLVFELAKLSERIFRTEPGVWNPSRLGAVYRQRALEIGAVTKDGRLRHAVLEAALAPRFKQLRDAFRILLPRPIDLQLGALLGAVIRGSPKPAHPLKHLVLLVAMFGDEAAVIEAINGRPEADLATFDRMEPIRSCGHATANQAAAKLETFLVSVEHGLSIRAAAAAAGVSTATGVRWARRHGVTFTPRPKVMTKTVLERIRIDLRRGQDRRIVASRYGLSVTSINRLLSTEHDLRVAWHDIRHEAARKKNRSRVMALIGGQPTISIAGLRQTPGSGWSWLYRHDRAWLEATLPTLWSRPVGDPESL